LPAFTATSTTFFAPLPLIFAGPAAASSLPPVAPLSRCRRRAALRPHEEMGMVVVLA